MDEPIITPCIQICELSEKQVCKGCGRTIDEIARWLDMTHEERAEIMKRLKGNERPL